MFKLICKASSLATLTLLFTLSTFTQAQAATIATFDVAVTGTIAATFAGSINGDASNDPNNYGLGGTATLDDSGVLSILYTSNAVTGVTDTVQDLAVNFSGGLAGNTLTSSAGDYQTLACTDNPAAFNGCVFVSLTFPTAVLPWTVSGLPAPIAFDLTPGGLTSFDATNITGSGQTLATSVYTFNLTTVPEPGTALLMGAGLMALSASRRQRA